MRVKRYRAGYFQLAQVIVRGSLASWKKYLDLAYPVKPADWSGELARIEAKLSEPGRMKALQAMCKASPGDAGAQLPNVACPVLVIEGSLDPDWADPRAEGEKIIADLPAGLGELAVIEGAGHYPHAQTPDEVARAGPAVPGQDAGSCLGPGSPRRRSPRPAPRWPTRSASLSSAWACSPNGSGSRRPRSTTTSPARPSSPTGSPSWPWTEFGDAIRDAIQGRAGRDALAAGAQAMRTYVQEHPGRYAAANAARPTGPDDPLIAATDRVIASWAAMLRGYQLDPGQEIHALRMLRSMLHGFATLEATGGFQIDADVDDSFTWMVNFIDHGLRASTAAPAGNAPAR